MWGSTVQGLRVGESGGGGGGCSGLKGGGGKQFDTAQCLGGKEGGGECRALLISRA